MSPDYNLDLNSVEIAQNLVGNYTSILFSTGTQRENMTRLFVSRTQMTT